MHDENPLKLTGLVVLAAWAAIALPAAAEAQSVHSVAKQECRGRMVPGSRWEEVGDGVGPPTGS